MGVAEILQLIAAAESIIPVAQQLYNDVSSTLSTSDKATIQAALAKAVSNNQAMRAQVDADLAAAAKN